MVFSVQAKFQFIHNIFLLSTPFTKILIISAFRVILEEDHPVEKMSSLINGNDTGPLQMIQNYTSSLMDNTYYDKAGLSRYDCIYIYTGKLAYRYLPVPLPIVNVM